VTQATPVQDERVASAARHWALRFVSNGIELGALQSTVQRIERWDQWCAEWGVTARHYEMLAEAAESRGDTLTAGESWIRAAMCWHFGKFVFMDDLAEQRAASATLAVGRTLGGELDKVTGRHCTFAFCPWNWELGDGCIIRLVAMIDPKGGYRIEKGEKFK